MSLDTMEARLVAAAGAKGIPIQGSLELLPLCNFNCRMCYVRLDRREQEAIRPLLTTEEWMEIGSRIQRAGTLFLTITGGEPLLYPGFREMYLHLKSLGFFITINTNGSLITEDWAVFFRENPPRRINITLYGGSRETYEKVCRAPEAFEKVMDGIRLLKKAGIAVKINASLSAGNCQDYEKILHLAEELGCPVSADTYMQPAVRERKVPYDFSCRMAPETAAAYDVKINRDSKGDPEFYVWAGQILDGIEERRKELAAAEEKNTMSDTDASAHSVSAAGMRCLAGKTSFAINWQGMLSPCVMLPQTTIPVLSGDFPECWEKLKGICSQLHLSGECARCPYLKICQICPAAALHEGGDPKKGPEYLCRYTKEYVRLLEESRAEKGRKAGADCD